MNQRSHKPESSAVTQTGAVRFGFRSTICSSSRSSNFIITMVMSSKWNARPGLARIMTLNGVANELSNRLIKLWLRNEKGERPFLRASAGAFNAATDSELYWFHEYFNGDNGGGLGASHQTGWTALVAKLIQQQGEFGTIT